MVGGMRSPLYHLSSNPHQQSSAGTTSTRSKKGRYRSASGAKRTIKYLAEVGDPRIQRIVLNASRDSVYKSICNAFFNMAQNSDIKLSPKQRKLLKPFQARIGKLISPSLRIRQKRRIIQSGGGIFLGTVLPLVLSSALSLLGSSFITRGK